MFKSFGFAINGIRQCFITEQNFRIHTVAAIVAIILAFVFNVSGFEWIAILFCIAFVISMEMLNTAIEKLCDVVHKEMHPLIKKVKDISAAAVLVSAIFSAIAGLIIFLPKIISFIKSF